MAKDPDPTKDPEFQKVVQTFLHTKLQPHKPSGKRKTAKKQSTTKEEKKRD
jgi:hypothetical protein